MVSNVSGYVDSNLSSCMQDLETKFRGVIVILVLECARSSHDSPFMHQNFKIVPDCALCSSK